MCTRATPTSIQRPKTSKAGLLYIFWTVKSFIKLSFSRLVVIESWTRVLNYMKQIKHDSFFKGAIGRSYPRLLYMNQLSSQDDQLFYCRDVLLTMPVVIYTKKSFYLLEE